VKINIKEPVKFVIHQTGEEVEFQAGTQEIENLDLRMERIIAQSEGKIELVKEKKAKGK
jgi:hypothetical protein